jgi:two-component system nitrogen regulation response regulator GlnG
MSRILIVDDEQSICWGLSRLAARMGHDALAASSAEQGLELAAANPPQLLILDVRLPGMDGLTAIERFRELIGAAPILVITAFGDLRTAVKAVEHGAFEYVVKPFDLAGISGSIDRALKSASVAKSEPGSGRSQAERGNDETGEMLGDTPAMQEVFKRIALAAYSDASVLIEGESGAGKELAARAIHRHSARREAAFVAVNVAALSPSLAEAELFGHVPGAFTGAVGARKGLLVQADGGTLFLDEVAEIPLPIQVKLLRALDQGEVLPVGADRPVQTHFRVVSATHRDLRHLVRTGDFRHDLFFRLCTFDICIPPLRQRPADIRLLARHFARRFAGDVTFAETALAELESRPWYGNVRELCNAVEHALVVARRGVIFPEHLPAPQPALRREGTTSSEDAPLLTQAIENQVQHLLHDPEAAGAVYERFLEEVEPPLLKAVMDEFGHQCAPAARAMGLHRTTLKRKLEQYGIGAQDDEG